jgi:AraC family transcriptional regulator of adaptative response/methylated-DNA-[protein]-cysteine methyltransferase
MQLKHQQGFTQPVPEGGSPPGYALVERAIAQLGASRAQALAVADLAARLDVSPAELERALFAWGRLSAAAFAEALTPGHIRNRLSRTRSWPAGSGRIHAFDVQIAASITDETCRRGAGLDIAYGFHASPFGEALLLMTEGGLCGLAFVDKEGGHDPQAALDDMAARWPRARFREAPCEVQALAARIFPAHGAPYDQVVPLTLIGTPFDLQVWQSLLQIPIGQLVSYTQIAQHLGHPSASRAVGTANGRNPISFVVPCHRALRGDGSLGGYYWGLTRKRAMIAWETGWTDACGANSASGP